MSDAPSDQNALRGLLDRVTAVLFDFDGPVTDLFGGASTGDTAARIRAAVGALWGPLDPDVRGCEDSHQILQRVRDMYDRPGPVPRDPAALVEAEAIVTRQEYRAALKARPAPGIAELLEALTAAGKRLVIVSNNAEDPIAGFLEAHGLAGMFEAVHGRDPAELRHMKPDPEVLVRASDRLGLPPRRCLLIGDQLTDLTAAQAAGTPFLGLTRSPRRAAAMRDRGADAVTDSHLALITAARSLR
ncbi:HAD family hydrolase [Streptomyces sp. NPDC048290]|uniref:HAD family hydrolase n=1 Tax=Streptomyces sp. NPDC048290 TaxID=3155811 RepID=UPI0034491D14